MSLIGDDVDQSSGGSCSGSHIMWNSSLFRAHENLQVCNMGIPLSDRLYNADIYIVVISITEQILMGLKLQVVPFINHYSEELQVQI